MSDFSFTTLMRAFPPAPEARFWAGSFKIEDATGCTIDEASEDLLERAYEILGDYEGGPRDSGYGCSSQIMSAAAKLIRLGLHPDAVEELVEDEVNQHIDPPYEDVGRKVGEAWRRFKQQEAQQRALEAELDAEFGLDDEGE